MFKKSREICFLFGIIFIFIAFGLFFLKNPIIEGHGGGGGGGGRGGGIGGRGLGGGGIGGRGLGGGLPGNGMDIGGRRIGSYYGGGETYYGGSDSEVNPIILDSYYGYPPVYISEPSSSSNLWGLFK